MTQATAAKPSLSQKVAAAGSFAGLNQGEIGQYLSGMKDRVAQVLPKHLTADRVLQMAATTIHRNPAIAKCSPASLLGSVMQASILGFPPVDALGYCYFVPYGKDIQFQIGYKGLVELARRSGKIKMVYAEVVREGDEFTAEFGLKPTLEHKPKFDSTKPLTHAYAVCHFNDGGHNFVVLSRSDIERLRMRSPMQKGMPAGAWATDYDAMAKAKALKQLSKYLPLNIDQAEAIATDEAVLKPENFERGAVKIEDVTYEEQIEETPATGIGSTVLPALAVGENEQPGS
jgi:recombination protein RecT